MPSLQLPRAERVCCWCVVTDWWRSSITGLALTCMIFSTFLSSACAQTVSNVTDSLSTFHVCKLANPANPSTAILHCPIVKVTGSKSLGTLSWYYVQPSGKLIHTSKRRRIYTMGDYKEQLLVVSAEATDSGTYVALSLEKPHLARLAICNFTLNVQEWSSQTQAKDLCDPVINYTKLSVQVLPALSVAALDGETYCLQTNVVTNVTSRFFCYNNSKSFQFSGASKLCHRAALQDNGTVYSFVGAGVARNDRHNLIVTVQEMALTVKDRTRLIGSRSSTNVSASAGQSVSIRCTASGPSPSISFRSDQHSPIDYTNTSGSIRRGDLTMNFSKVNATLVQLVVTIGNVNIKHSGNYRCHAKSAHSTHAEDEIVFFLSVAEQPVVSIHLESCADSSLRCTAIGLPLPAIRWQHDGQPIRADLLQHKVISSREVVSTLYHDSSEGRYACSASNSAGASSAVYVYDGTSCDSAESKSDKFVWVAPSVLGPVALVLLLLLLLRWRVRWRKQCKCSSTTKCRHCKVKATIQRTKQKTEVDSSRQPPASSSYITVETSVVYTDSHTTISDCGGSSDNMLPGVRDSPASLGGTTRIVSVEKRTDPDAVEGGEQDVSSGGPRKELRQCSV